jgi:hypothetical protein
MSKKTTHAALALSLMLILAAPTFAQNVIGTYSSLSAFNAALGAAPMTVEDFTATSHFPITTGILNSLTNLPGIGIVPGTIQPGVTYSTAIGSGNFFNIDSGGNFSGGFLDTVTGVGPLTITFAAPVGAFGFDTDTIMGTSLPITINFTTGSPYTNAFVISSGTPAFYGFQSNAANITSVVVGVPGGGAGGFTFAIDNFRFTSVPEPGTIWLMGSGLAILAVLRRRRPA